MHTVIDDHTRVAHVEIREDETATTPLGVLQRAVGWFADHGGTEERVLSDNGSAFRSHPWRDACTEFAMVNKCTRPYRPPTNGKIERFHRTLADGWAYARFTIGRPSAAQPCRPGSTSTNTTAPTPPPEAGHRSPD